MGTGPTVRATHAGEGGDWDRVEFGLSTWEYCTIRIQGDFQQGYTSRQLIAVAVAVVAAFYWDQESHLIFQGKHSVVLVACTIVAGGVGTLSNVTYWALCVRYKGTHCTKGMSVGMTVGGLLLQLCALAQGVGKPKPRFSAKTFMLGVASVQAFFAVAVMFIIRRPHPQEERTPKSLRNVPRGDLAPRETFTRTASKRTFGGSDVQLNKLHQPLLPVR
jgi:hypothetical protein